MAPQPSATTFLGWVRQYSTLGVGYSTAIAVTFLVVLLRGYHWTLLRGYHWTLLRGYHWTLLRGYHWTLLRGYHWTLLRGYHWTLAPQDLSLDPTLIPPGAARRPPRRAHGLARRPSAGVGFSASKEQRFLPECGTHRRYEGRKAIFPWA
jgi:hypothetical protein